MSKEKPATKICKHCQTEIPYGAKICPQCRKKQGGKLKWFIIAILVLAVIGAAAGGSGDDKPQKVGDTNDVANSNSSDTEPSTNKETDKNAENDNSKELENDKNAENDNREELENDKNAENDNSETIFKKGEIAELNGVQVTLTDYKESTGSEYNTPSEGNVFLMAEFEITNNTSEVLAISSMLSFEAYADDYKLDYSFSALMEKEGNQLDGEIAAGKKMKGWIGWELPQDYQNVEVHFTDNVWSNDKFMFLIEK